MIRTYNNLFCVYVVLLVAWPKYWLFPIGPIAVSPFTLCTQFLIAYLLLLAVVSRDVAGHLRRAIRRNVAVYAVWLLWIGWRVLCDLVGYAPMDSLAQTFRSVLYSESILVVGLVPFGTGRIRAILPKLLLSISLATIAFGLYEYQAQRTLANIFGLSFTGLSEQAVLNATRQAVEFFRDGAYRAASSFSHSIVFGQFVGALVPVAICLTWSSRGAIRLVGLLALAATPVALEVSGARSGYVVAAVSTMTYLGQLLLGKALSPRRLTIVLGAAAFFAVLLLGPIQAAVESVTRGSTGAEQSSSAARDEMLNKGLYALQSRPLVGYGQGISVEVAGLVGRNDSRTIDNHYLSTAVDFGYVGIALHLLLLLLCMGRQLSSTFLHRGRSEQNLAKAYVATSLAILVGQSVLSIFDNFSVFLLLTTLAVSTVIDKTAASDCPQVRSQTR